MLMRSRVRDLRFPCRSQRGEVVLQPWNEANVISVMQRRNVRVGGPSSDAHWQPIYDRRPVFTKVVILHCGEEA